MLVSHPITPTTTLAHSIPPPVRLQASPQAAGFDLLGLANNHALDVGPAGLAESVSHLQAVGLSTFDTGITQDQALQPSFITIKGVRLGFLSINAIPVPPETGLPETEPRDTGLDIARWERSPVLEAVRLARTGADVVLVSIHWGYEYQVRTDPAQVRLGQLLIDAGADIIIGHHPHVIQSPEILQQAGRRTQLIAYSLGNFVFDQGEDATGFGLALRFLVNRDGLQAAQALLVLAGSRPRLQAPAAAAPAEPQRQAAAFDCDALRCAAVAPACEPASGFFDTGRADLDGEVPLEEIRLEGGRITIWRQAEKVWTSPVSWQVVDAALGDLDQAGRPDLVAIFWKADQAGDLRSHPFLIRSAGGRCQEVWGGSAVSAPILEVEVGDLDGDGLDELAILEQSLLGSQSLSVWRWHGWGLNQDWRSVSGAYQSLVLVSKASCGAQGGGSLILTTQAK